MTRIGKSRKSMAALVALAAMITLGTGGPQPARAQTGPEPVPAGETFAGFAGAWSGQGWMMKRGGERETFDIFETVAIAAGGHALIIEGEGFAPAGAGREGRPVHQAAGLLFAGPDGYRMRSVTGAGLTQSARVEPHPEGFDWFIEIGPGAVMRYETRLEGGMWREDGYFCRDGETCRQTFHMELELVR